jgi:hypothetical protein
MNEPHLHEMTFEDDNHYNLYLMFRHLRMKVVNPEKYSVEKQEYLGRYKVSLGDQLIYIADDLYGKFWVELSKNLAGVAQEMYESVWSVNQPDKIRPNVDVLDVPFTINEEDEFYSLMGIDYTNVENRIRGLMTATTKTIAEIALILNKEMAAVALDTNIVKDFDAIVTFRSEPGRKFKAELCFDKVLPIDPANDGLEIQRTPITAEDLKTYMPNAGEKVVSRLDHINGLVRSVFESKRIAEVETLTKYAETLINAVLLPPFLDQNVTFFQFGGRDDWSSVGKETPNNKVCFEYLDKEVDKLFKMLEGIPLQEGVEVWSIDLDTFAIFGRKDNKVVTPALQGYTENILLPMSQGFERVFTMRLGLIDSPHIFKA